MSDAGGSGGGGRLELRQSRGRLALALLAALGFVAIGVGLIAAGNAIGWAAVVVFGLFAAGGVFGLVRRRPMAVLDEEGATIDGVRLRWDEVASVELDRMEVPKYRVYGDFLHRGSSEMEVMLFVPRDPSATAGAHPAWSRGVLPDSWAERGALPLVSGQLAISRDELVSEVERRWGGSVRR